MSDEYTDKLSLLHHCTSGGCGAKIGPGDLAGILAGIPARADPNLLVGFDGSDDAAVYRLPGDGTQGDKLLVSTVDFFPPMVDDPFVFGQIACANALSDIYAMGGRPLFALNLVCFPEKLDKSVLGKILAGGAHKASEAEVTIAGGHSIYDHEPKYGLAVTGEIRKAAILRNTGGHPGDAVILTKALGVGLVMAAHREGQGDEGATKAATESMVRLNRDAAQVIERYQMASPAAPPVHACTDVTGFGLGVHASEMAGTDRTLIIDTKSLEILPGALDFAEKHIVTAGGQRNRKHLTGKADFAALSAPMQEIVFDPQTSGGLLVAVAPEAALGLCRDLQRADPASRIIGFVTQREGPTDPAVIFV
jgi:selenide,water dikinase